MRLAAEEAEAVAHAGASPLKLPRGWERPPDLMETSPFTSVEMIDFPDGAHAATFRVKRPSGSYLVTVESE
jgi:hypothetical protein